VHASRVAWPTDASEGRRVGIVVANFNTRRLIAQLVFSLYRVLGRSEFAQLVVVDNASTDGSRELLGALHGAGLIHLICNSRQRYHGPALTQGISWLARRQGKVAAGDRLDYVWVLDSDVIILRSDTVRAALELFKRPGAAAVGQTMGDVAYDGLLCRNREMLDPCSLMIDPARIWRAPIPPFIEDGAPSTALQIAAGKCGLDLVGFPFVESGYLLHLGRGTLRQLARTNDAANRYYNWALDHRHYHFGGQANGANLLRDFSTVFEAEVGSLTPARLVAACRRPQLLTLG
jgi:hypothetical protein